MSDRSAIARMADRVSIVPSYRDVDGRTVRTSDETRVALLAAMGYDTATEAAVTQEIERRDAMRGQRLIEPVAVLPAGSQLVRQLEVRLPADVTPRKSCFHLTVGLDCGDEITTEVAVSHRRGGTLWLRLPEQLDLGYHTIDLRIATPGRDFAAVQRRIVHPISCTTVAEVLGPRRAFGIWTSLYTIRSGRNFGVGDLTDLTRLVDWAHEHGGEFLGINPLHALRNRGEQISPYNPTSRLFRNEIYLDVAAVPELARSAKAKAMIAALEEGAELERLRAASHVEYQAVSSLKLRVLRPLYDTLINDKADTTAARLREFSAYKRRAETDLATYATFRALEDYLLRQGQSANWQEWPQRFRLPDSPAVQEFSRANAREIDFLCYVQFELERQVEAVASKARSVMAVGVYGDLALGSDPTGADAWAHQDLLVAGAHVGAPPDDFATEGQDWGLSPVSPEALRASGYDHWIRLLRANLRHTGALRLDHAMGLFRQFWIPRGLPGSMGAYVKFPASDLLGILALESNRHRTIIVGEDLGTVPPGFQSLLARWGILSSRVLYFERDRRKMFRPYHAYSKRAMVTANTHDQVPLAGYWEGRDLMLRSEAGAYPDARSFEHAREERNEEQRRLRRRLESAGLPTSEQAQEDTALLTRAVHTFLAKTPAPLVGLSLDDLAGEKEPVNLPGICNARFQSWSRKMGVPLEELVRDPEVAHMLRVIAVERLGHQPDSEP